MSAPKIGDDGLIFEDRPLPTAILQSIPTEVGLWKTAVVCTCIEANEDYIVVGSEQGYVWVIDLETYRLVREYNEFRVAITVVKLCPTRDLLAYGTNDGHVRIEKITRPMANKWRVQEKDKQSVSCLEWTQSGDELFCGFALGRVIQLRINVHDNTMTPLTFPESYGSHVTQISSRGHTLLVSTVERTWIVHTQTHKLEQVGRKDRKPGQYGGCLVQGGEKAYVARPGLRLWSADSTGKVLRTMLYKEALSTQHLPQVPLQSWSSLVPSYNKAWQFSSVRAWVGEHFVVTTLDHTLFVLDPENGSVVGVLSLGHPINSIAITRGFVYLLCNDLKKPICRVCVKQSFLKALQKTLPLSPAHSPRISPARKVLPLQDGASHVSTKLLSPTGLVPTPTVTAEERSGEQQAKVSGKEKSGQQHVCSEPMPQVSVKEGTEKDSDIADCDGEPFEVGHKESLNPSEAVIESKEESKDSKAEETVPDIPDSKQTLTMSKFQEEQAGIISESQKDDSTKSPPFTFDGDSIQPPLAEDSLGLSYYRNELPEVTTELADSIAVVTAISEASVTNADEVTSESSYEQPPNLPTGNNVSQIEASVSDDDNTHQLGKEDILTDGTSQLESIVHSDEHSSKEESSKSRLESAFVDEAALKTESEVMFLSDVVESSAITRTNDTGTAQSSSDTNVEDTTITESEQVIDVDQTSKSTQEPQPELSDKTGSGPEQPTLQEALSTMKAEVRELFKPKFDKFTSIFKAASPGSLSPGRLRVVASRNTKDGREHVEDGKEEKKSNDLEVHIANDNTRPSPPNASNQKQEKTEQEQTRKPDLKEILKLSRISNLLNKESSGISMTTPSSATPTSVTTTPIIVTSAPLDPIEHQRRFRMSQTKEDEDDVVVKTKAHHRKKKRRRHKKLSSATSSVSVSLEQLTEFDEELDSPTPLSSIATPLSRTASPCQPFAFTDEQRAKLELIKRERNGDSESKASDVEQTVLESLPENQSGQDEHAGLVTLEAETENLPPTSTETASDETGVNDGSNLQQEILPEDTASHSVADTTEDIPLFDDEVCGSESILGVVKPKSEPSDYSINSEKFDELPDELFGEDDEAPPSLDVLLEEPIDDVLHSKSHSPGLNDSVANSHEKSTTTTLGELSDNPLYHDSDHEISKRQDGSDADLADETKQTAASRLSNNPRMGSRSTLPRHRPSVLRPTTFDPLSDESYDDHNVIGEERNDLFATTPVNFRHRAPSDSPVNLIRKRRQQRPTPIVSGSWSGFDRNKERREGSAEASDSSREEEEDDVNLQDSQVVPDFYQLCGSLVRNSNQRKEATLASRFSWANSAFQQQATSVDESEEETEESSSNADIWVPIPHPGRSHLQWLCLTDVLLWVIDGRSNVFCTTMESKGKDWQLIKKSMQQVSSSPTGKIVWGMNHQNAYVRLGIGMNPAGSTWRNVTKGTFLSRKIKRLTVDENSVWAITTDNKMLFRKGVEESNPEGQVWQEVFGEGFAHIACCKSIVWAHTNQGKVFIREGITPSTPSGKSWMEVKCPKLTAACITNAGVAWGINHDGSIGFRCGVCPEKPAGKGPWWEIKINALTHPSSPYNSFWEVMSAEGGHLLTSVTSLMPHQLNHNKPLSLAASAKSGVIVLQDGNRLHACWRSATGYHYRPASRNDLFSLTTWSKLAAGGTGLWLVRDDGDLYCLTLEDKLKRIEIPSAVSLVASSPTCLWIVANHLIWSRQGLSPELSEGGSFDYIELSPQLHERKIRYIACGKTAVWALDRTGVPHFRFGVHSREPGTGMSPAWIPVDDLPHPLLQIAVCPDNWLVWACDEKRNAYVRTGVTHDFPIGRTWELVPSELIKEVCVTNEKVYGLTPSGELLCRYGIAEGNVQGNYWRRMPGRYEHITTGTFGELWTLDSKGQVWKQEWKILAVSHDPQAGQDDFEMSMVVDQSWEVV